MEVEVDTLACTVWLNLAPPKVEFFPWLALLGKLNTKDMLFKKWILQKGQNVCTFCSLDTESLDHILMACSFSWRIWCCIANELGQHLLRPVTFRQFYKNLLALPWRNSISKKLWGTTFFAVAWSLWMVRNGVIFQQQELETVVLCHAIRWRVALWTKTWKAPLPYTMEEIARNFASLPSIFS